MSQKFITLALILLTTLMLAAQVPTAQPPTAASPSSRAADAHPADTPAAVRATIAEKTKELASADPAHVAAAAYWLGEIGSAAAGAVPQLAAILGDSRKVDPARYRKLPVPRTTSPGEEAARALTKIGAPAIEALIAVLKNSPNAVARQNAAWALGVIQNRHTPGALAATQPATLAGNWKLETGN